MARSNEDASATSNQRWVLVEGFEVEKGRDLLAERLDVGEEPLEEAGELLELDAVGVWMLLSGTEAGEKNAETFSMSEPVPRDARARFSGCCFGGMQLFFEPGVANGSEQPRATGGHVDQVLAAPRRVEL